MNISVIIPTYKRPLSLRRLLASIAKQNFPGDQIEVIVVDDQSGENLESVIAEFRELFRIECLISRKKGRPGARNTGAAAARGEVLIFLDDDMELEAGALEAHMLAHEANPHCLVCGKITPALRLSSLWNELIDNRFDMKKKHATIVDMPTITSVFTGNLSIQSMTFNQIGGFDEDTFSLYGGEDFDFGIRCRNQQIRIMHVPEAAALHYERPYNRVMYMRHLQWAAVSMAVLLNKHRDIVNDDSAFKGFPCALPGIYDPGGKKWKNAIKRILCTPPLLEMGLIIIGVFGCKNMRTIILKPAMLLKRLYYERNLARAIKAHFIVHMGDLSVQKSAAKGEGK